jgi:hypothetical protein
MIALGSPIDADELRLRDQFLSIEGLRLTVPQAARLLNLRLAHAGDLLNSLESTDFLKRLPDGAYQRRSVRIS